MKYYLLALLLCGTNVFAHDFPNKKGICTFNGSEPTPCTIENGGGAGGSYYILKSKKDSIYVESDCSGDNCALSIGANSDNTVDAKEFKKDGFYCTSSNDNKLTGCFKTT
ncbi:hypothetical protein P256_00697 [Acinetobacter nectaris CIP 110549]|uniref:Uncharacterized protein n=1 Tax=Acinetobacter nectaris CIP 110549 TaxID=1392540 RepID=V2TVB7_9GAMM|nr:hypothetical protein [Acinetobacter nectaris]ESK40250.1 hypothetical protein P256_00697 [Acinetobacter nectaris CIP 110549]